MRKILVGAITVATVCMASAAVAQAATTATTPSQTQAQRVISRAEADTVQEWRYVDWYWTYGNCASNGGQLVTRQEAREWRCDQSPYNTFYLYVR